MNRLEWLDTATKKILFRPDRKAVRKELEAHFEDLREASGLDEEAAAAAMGDPEAVAEELGRLHRPWWGYMWQASRMILVLAFILWFLCGQRYGFSELKNWMYAMPPLPEELTEDYHPPGYTQPGNVSVLELWHPEGTKNLRHYRLTVPAVWLEQGTCTYQDENGKAFQQSVCRLRVCLQANTWKFWAAAPLYGTMIPAVSDSEGNRYDLGPSQQRMDPGGTGCSAWQGPFTTWYLVALELPGPEDVPEWIDLSVGRGGGTVRVDLETEVVS